MNGCRPYGCNWLPRFLEIIHPYLLLWRYAPDTNRPGRLVKRQGEARETDEYE